MTITRDEWLAALGESSLPNPDALTTHELAAMYGFSRKTMGDRLTDLVRKGKAQRVVTIRNGRRQSGYILVKGKR